MSCFKNTSYVYLLIFKLTYFRETNELVDKYCIDVAELVLSDS